MAHADWIIDLGPGAGNDGGRIIFDDVHRQGYAGHRLWIIILAAALASAARATAALAG